MAGAGHHVSSLSPHDLDLILEPAAAPGGSRPSLEEAMYMWRILRERSRDKCLWVSCINSHFFRKYKKNEVLLKMACRYITLYVKRPEPRKAHTTDDYSITMTTVVING